MGEIKPAKPKVFLSYSHKDIKTVEPIAILLKNRGIDVWYDEWNLLVGSSLIKEIQDGIRHADFVILFLSDNSVTSPWVNEEFEASKVIELEMKDRLKILPARLDDCDFPLFLNGKIYADFRKSFAYGFSKLLFTILDEKRINPLDRVISKYSRKVIEFPDTIKFFKISDITKSLSHSRSLFWKETIYSAQAIGRITNSEDIFRELEIDERIISKWLGNMIRDYLQYRVYFHCSNLLLNENVGDYSVNIILLKLLDEIYTQLNSDIYEYGLVQSRDGINYVALSVEKIMAP